MLLTASSDGTARIYELLIYQNVHQTHHQNPQTRLNNQQNNKESMQKSNSSGGGILKSDLLLSSGSHGIMLAPQVSTSDSKLKLRHIHTISNNKVYIADAI